MVNDTSYLKQFRYFEPHFCPVLNLSGLHHKCILTTIHALEHGFIDNYCTMTKNIQRLNFLVTLIGFLDTHLLIPVIALYATALGAGIGSIGLIVGIYSITNTFANLLGGRLTDRFGYKAPLILGLIGDAVAMFSYALCQSPWHLALVRAFHGFSGGFVGPATMSASAKHTSALQRGRVMGLYGLPVR